MSSGFLNNVFSLSALNSSFRVDRVRKNAVIDAFTEIEATYFLNDKQPFTKPLITNPACLELRMPPVPLFQTLSPDELLVIQKDPLKALECSSFIDQIVDVIDVPTQSTATLGMYLGQDEENCMATDWSISMALSGGGKIGFTDQWFILFWYLVTHHPALSVRCSSVLQPMKDHMKYRLLNHHHPAALSSVPYFPMATLPLAECMWFIIHAHFLPTSHPEFTETIRGKATALPVYIELLKMSNLTISPEAEHYCNMLAASNYLTASKPDSSERLVRLVGSVFNTVRIDLEQVPQGLVNTNFRLPLIPLDGAPCHRAEYIDNIPLHLQLVPVDAIKAAVWLFLNNRKCTPQNLTHVHECNWGYGLDPIEKPYVPICPLTMRPFIVNAPDFVNWKDRATHMFCALSECINCHFLVPKYIAKYKSFPNKDSFLAFAFNYYIERKPALPVQMMTFVDVLFEQYDIALKSNPLSVSEFNSVSKETWNYERRRDLELMYYHRQGVDVPIQCYSRKK